MVNANITKKGLSTLYIGIDISKNTHTASGLTLEGLSLKPFSFKNTAEGFAYFWDRITRFQLSHGLKRLEIGVESTGHYGTSLLYYLSEKPVTLRQVNPCHSKRMKELIDNSPLKSDVKDPGVISTLLALGHSLSVRLPAGLYADLRVLVHHRDELLQDSGRSYNRLEHVISVLFPEYLQVMKGLKSKSSLALLRRYACPSSLPDPRKLSSLLKRVSRGRLGHDRAQALYQAAQHSIGVKQGRDAMLIKVAHLLGHIDLLAKQIKDIETDIQGLLAQIPASKYLLSIKGIGLITTATLLAEVCGFSDFPTQAQVLKLAGLNLYEVSSGKLKGKRKISKRGRPLLRKALFIASLNMVKKQGIFHELYQHHLSKGMPPISALTAISRKLLVIAYTLVKKETCYIKDSELLKKAAA